MDDKINKIIEESNTPITDKLDILCDEVSIEDGEKIAAKLFRTLTEHSDGIGLSANQIGINKRVAVVNVKQPYHFINPRIVEKSGEVIFMESCLSFPGKIVRTKRYTSIIVECDNYESQLYWDVSYDVQQGNYIVNKNVLECIAVQHEISHLENRTMFDDEYKQDSIKSDKVYSRNDKVKITNNIETITVKYKKYDAVYKAKGYKII